MQHTRAGSTATPRRAAAEDAAPGLPRPVNQAMDAAVVVGPVGAIAPAKPWLAAE